jgi:Protein of unknown function (DUF3551)
MIVIRSALVLLAVTAFAAIDARSAAAEIYRPWCVQYSGGSGNNGLTCAFSSFEQCMMTGGPGTGGSCVQNPWYLCTESMAKDKAAATGGDPSGNESRVRLTAIGSWQWRPNAAAPFMVTC